MTTQHAKVRACQRAIPPLIAEWLEEFGEEQYDGHGSIKRYFGRSSVRRMEKRFGKLIVQHNSKWLRAYMVESAQDGSVITIGWRQRKIKR